MKLQTPQNISDYLSDITDYTGSMTREEFLNHFLSIPNVEEKFNQLLKENPDWVELANCRAPEFFYERISSHSKCKDAFSCIDLQLCIFDCCFGSGCPIIKVEEYVVPD